MTLRLLVIYKLNQNTWPSSFFDWVKEYQGVTPWEKLRLFNGPKSAWEMDEITNPAQDIFKALKYSTDQG